MSGQIPYEECERWINQSITNVALDLKLAELQAVTALNIQRKFKTTKPYGLRIIFCRKCKRFSPPIFQSIYRIRNKVLIVSCGRCGRRYRHPLLN